MFYTFSQNNTGGTFVYDEQAGIGPYVIVEAVTAQMANLRARSIGLYFNGCDDGRDCCCCGDRWYETEDRAAAGLPEIYGAPAEDYRDDYLARRTLQPEIVYLGFVHYADRIEPLHKIR